MRRVTSTKKRMRNLNLTNRLSLGAIFVALTVVFALGYTAFAATPFISGPKLSASVEDLGDGQVRISGTTERVSSVWITDLPIPITDQGDFSVIRSYPPGYTEVVVRAADRFGRSREEKRSFVNTHFIAYAEKDTSKQDNQESSEDRSSGSTEGNEGGEASGN